MLKGIHQVIGLSLLLASYSSALGEQLSKTEVGKIGKAATALVEVKERNASGSAFCVHDSGLFVTNEHVVSGISDQSTVTLVLNPGLKTQKVLKARVIRSDKELDLAVLRIEGKENLPTLALGSDSDLSELNELIAFGFPFGESLTPTKGEYPAISINSGSITSLRRKNGELHRIQLDAGVNPGNSGGPVLDLKGKVVGVVASGVRGTTVNFAIPVSHVIRFLARPDIQFTPPLLTRKNLNTPITFEAKVVPLLPNDSYPAVELALSSGQGKERSYKMERSGDVYRITAAPVPPTQPLPAVRVTVNYSDGSLSGFVSDLSFKMGERSIKLSDIASLQFHRKGKVLFHDGTVMEGVISGLDRVVVQLGSDKIQVNLSKATEAKFDIPGSVETVTLTFRVTRDDKEVERRIVTLNVQDIARSSPIPGPALAPAKLGQDKVIYKLSSSISDVVVAGGGRYLILHLARERKLEIFDVVQAQVVHSVPLPSDNVKIAAGMNKLMIGFPSNRLIQRWDLRTFQREGSGTLPFNQDIKQIAMGSASDGPLLAGGRFLDIKTFQPARILAPNKEPVFVQDDENIHIRASANGEVFGSWASNMAPSGIRIYSIVGDSLRTNYLHQGGGHVLPGPDGRAIYTSSLIFNRELKLIGQYDHNHPIYYLPSVEGNYYMGFSPVPKPTNMDIYVFGDDRPLVHRSNIDLDFGNQAWDHPQMGAEKRIFFVPSANVIITIPTPDDHLVLHRFDLDQELDKSGVDYLFVGSQAPTYGRKGQTYTYQLSVKSKKGGVKFRLESGPKGMNVSKSGVVTWNVASDYVGKEATVVVSVSDAAGQEMFHSFQFEVRD